MFQKPTTKTATSAAIMAGGFVVGAKLGDGLASIVPEAAQPYRRWLIGIAGIAAAACVNTKTTAGEATQAALLGMGSKQILDEVTEMLTDKVDAQDASTTTGKFMNAVIGHRDVAYENADMVKRLGNSADWKPADEAAMWDRPAVNEYAPFQEVFTGV